VADDFHYTFGREGQKRLSLLFKVLEVFPDPNNSYRVLEELEKLKQRKWLDGEGVEERNTILQLQYGNLLYLRRDYRSALQIYLEAEKKVPEKTTQLRKDVTKALQEVAWEVDSEKGIIAYQQAIDLNLESAYVYNGLGDMYYLQGNYVEAIRAYQEAIKLDPAYAYPHNGLGNVYAYQDKYEDAVIAYRHAIELDPKCASAYNGLGWAYLMKNDLVKAQEKFEYAIPLDPKRYYPIFNLGLVYALQGNIEEAKSKWNQGLQICYQGSNGWSRAYRALYTVAIGEVEFGINEIQQLLAADKSAIGVAREILGDAQVLARCPIKLDGIDQVIAILQESIKQ
jgi:tetratricopeptide (TPR) repeat protein